MAAAAHKITIDLLMDDQGTFQVTNVSSSMNLQPSQLGLIFLALIQGILRGEAEQKPRPLVEIPEMVPMSGPRRSM